MKGRMMKYDDVYVGDFPPADTGGTITTPNTVGYMAVIPNLGKYNYRVEYKCGDETKTTWVDADRYDFGKGFPETGDDICRFYLGSDVVFLAVCVWSITPTPNPTLTPIRPWSPVTPPPFLPPYFPGPSMPHPSTPWVNPNTTIWCGSDAPSVSCNIAGCCTCSGNET